MLKFRKFTAEKLDSLLKAALVKESAYWTERKFYPDDPDDDLVKSSERDEMVKYLLEVCQKENVDFCLETFALSTALLDRFLANYKVKSKYLVCLAVACLYIASKVKEEDENVSITGDFLYDFGCKCSVSELLRMEIMVLNKFEWSIDDITAVDFMYLFHGLLVNKYNEAVEIIKQPGETMKSIWKPIDNKAALNLNSNSDLNGFYLPADLDFLHIIENKMKQCLCAHELTTLFRPHVIAFALLQIEIDKRFGSNSNIPVNDLIRRTINETMENLLSQHHIKTTKEHLIHAMEQIESHLEAIEAQMDLDDIQFDFVKNSRLLQSLQPFVLKFSPSPPLSAINTNLTSIKEEDDEDDMEYYKMAFSNRIDNCIRKLEQNFNILNTNGSMPQPIDTASNKDINSIMLNLTYADILLGKQNDQNGKRKLSENSSTDEDYECDYNRE